MKNLKLKIYNYIKCNKRVLLFIIILPNLNIIFYYFNMLVRNKETHIYTKNFDYHNHIPNTYIF